MMQYKGYVGRVEIDLDAALLHGEVINVRDMITFQATSVAEIQQAFHDSVDDYLAFCDERGEAPDKPFSGQFLMRISPELQRKAGAAAAVAGKSLNAWITEVIEASVPAKSDVPKRRTSTAGTAAPVARAVRSSKARTTRTGKAGG